MVDTLTAVLTWSMQKGSVNIRALFVHNLSDALASGAVIVGGVLILLFDIRWVDPAITILIAVYILYLAFTEIGDTVRTLMLVSPQDIETDAVIDAVASVDGVSDVHHTHFWQMQEHQAALDTHVVIGADRWNEVETIKDAIKARLKDDFSITDTTLEFERSQPGRTVTKRYGHG